MATSLAEIYDLFMQRVTDYRLTELYQSSTTDFENFLEAWLKFSIVDFNICGQSLVFDSTTKEFTATLTDENQVILATLMVKYWLKKLVNDITQMNLHITDRDFKTASEAQNLTAKSNYLITVTEECSQLLQNYGYNKLDWANWRAGQFYS
jgi:hypothetical protein